MVLTTFSGRATAVLFKVKWGVKQNMTYIDLY